MIAAAPARFAVGFAFVVSGAFSVANAQSANIVLDNLSMPAKDQGTVAIKHLEVTGTNLTNDEVAKLFNPSTPKDQSAAIAAKMKADKIAIPEILVTSKDGTMTFHDLVATNVNAGKIGNAVLSGFDGSFKKDGKDAGSIKSNQIQVQSLSMRGLVAAAGSGDLSDASPMVGHITWSGAEMNLVDDDTPASAPGGNLIKVHLGSFDAQGTYDGDVPVKGAGVMKNLVIEPPKASKFGQSLTSFGYEKLDIGFTFAGTYDKAKKTYVIDDYTVSGVDAGALGIKAQIGGIEPTVFTADKNAKMAALMNATASSLALNYSDKGLFDKVIGYYAKQQKKSPDALKKEWSSMATQMLPLLLAGDPAALKLADAVGKFVMSPKSLTISAKAKGAPLKFTDLASIRDPHDLLSKIDLGASANQ